MLKYKDILIIKKSQAFCQFKGHNTQVMANAHPSAASVSIMISFCGMLGNLCNCIYTKKSYFNLKYINRKFI